MRALDVWLMGIVVVVVVAVRGGCGRWGWSTNVGGHICGSWSLVGGDGSGIVVATVGSHGLGE